MNGDNDKRDVADIDPLMAHGAADAGPHDAPEGDFTEDDINMADLPGGDASTDYDDSDDITDETEEDDLPEFDDVNPFAAPDSSAIAAEPASQVVKMAVVGALSAALIGGLGYSMLSRQGIIGGSSAQLPHAVATPQNTPTNLQEAIQEATAPGADSTLAAERPVQPRSLAEDGASSSELIGSGQVTREEFRKILREELAQQSDGDRAWMGSQFASISVSQDVQLTGDSTGLLDRLQSLGIKVSQLDSSIQQHVQTNSVLVDSLQNDGVLSADERRKLLGDRKRLKGFQVVNASSDNTMSILRTPSGRTQVFFAGEKFYNNGKTQSVTGIHNQGKLILVGDHGFIDDVYEKPVKTVANKAPVKQTVAIKEPVTPAKPAISPEKGWSFHGVVDEGYLVRTAAGDWQMIANGEFVPTLGAVKGLNQSNDLLIGAHAIALAN